jgi:hypothetical protein
MVHTRGGRLLLWSWWPVGPKLHFDQMTAPVPEIMDDSLYGRKIVLCYSELQYKIFLGRAYTVESISTFPLFNQNLTSLHCIT